MSEDLRQHPRFRVALRAHLGLPGGTVTTTTTGVSRNGMSLKLTRPPALDQEIPVTVELPNGTSIDGKAWLKSTMPDAQCGMAVEFAGDAQALWEGFVDEEESTGSLWRMIGRIARAPDDALAPRGLRERVDAEDLRFHTAGENGEAYRVAFEKHPFDPGEGVVARVLREPMWLRFDDGAEGIGEALPSRPWAAQLSSVAAAPGKVVHTKVAELTRGGYVSLHNGPSSLAVGELILVAKNGKSVFPYFTDDELERIACDTFRRDLGRPVFKPAARPAPVALPPLAPAKFREGLDAVRFAQAAADDVQTRRYGDRDVFFHPSVWARVNDAAGELMGPTLHDGVNICVLALVGPGAPRVVRLDANSKVKLLKPPR